MIEVDAATMQRNAFAFIVSGTTPDRGLRNEYGTEVYWRVQLLKRMHITPNVQIYLNPAKNRDVSTQVVFGLRLAVYL